MARVDLSSANEGRQDCSTGKKSGRVTAAFRGRTKRIAGNGVAEAVGAMTRGLGYRGTGRLQPHHRAAPLTTKSGSRAPHSEHRSNRAQSGTGIPEPCCATWTATSARRDGRLRHSGGE